MYIKLVFILAFMPLLSFKPVAPEKILVLLNRRAVTFSNRALPVHNSDTISIRIYTKDTILIKSIEGIAIYGYEQGANGQCKKQQDQQQMATFEEPGLTAVTTFRRGNGYIEFMVIPKKHKLCKEEQFELEIVTELQRITTLQGFLKSYKFRLHG